MTRFAPIKHWKEKDKKLFVDVLRDTSRDRNEQIHILLRHFPERTRGSIKRMRYRLEKQHNIPKSTASRHKLQTDDLTFSADNTLCFRMRPRENLPSDDEDEDSITESEELPDMTVQTNNVKCVC